MLNETNVDNKMKKIICLAVSALMAGVGSASAQGVLDAYKFSQSDLNGTARYLSMGGAFGALGGDISVLSNNPAGLGIYRSSEVVTTLSLSPTKTSSDWNGSKVNASKNKFNFDNIAYVGYFPTGNDEGLVSWNVGLSYNRVMSFDRNYRASGAQAYSVADYLAAQASYVGQDNKGGWFGIKEDDFAPLLGDNADNVYDQLNSAYQANVWPAALGYQGGLIGSYEEGGDLYHSAFGEWQGNEWLNYSPNEVRLDVSERGSIDRYNLAFAANISNRFFLGATVAITDLDYTLNSIYDEKFATGDLYYDNYQTMEGTGYALNIGAIVRPTDFLRLGVAYNSPTWYKMSYYYKSEAGSYIDGLGEMAGTTPTNPYPYTDFRLRTPDKWIFSAAGFLGQSAMISVDYELTNYKRMNLSDSNGYEYADNALIDSDMGLMHTIRVGAEYKVTPQFSVRAGGGWQSSPLNQNLRDGKYEVFPGGLATAYTIDKGLSYFSVGLGYRFTPNFYMDLACVYQERKEDVYAFSNVIIEDARLVESESIALKTTKTRVALTLGYKF